MVRIAAVADIHTTTGSVRQLRGMFNDIAENADILILPGDLTNLGLIQEGEVLLGELADCKIDKVAVLGNHDVFNRQNQSITGIMQQAGVNFLDNGYVHFIENVGIAGIQGYHGGWPEDRKNKTMSYQSAQPLLKQAETLGYAIEALGDVEHKIVVMHYSPTKDTLVGESPAIFFKLGSDLFGEVIDDYKIDVVLHGHAHNGTHKGFTPGGIPVYNVALPIMKKISPDRPYFTLNV